MRKPLVYLLTFVQVAALVCGLPVVAHADPVITPAILIGVLKSVAISAAVSAAAYGLQRILIRPKPLQTGRRSGEILIQDSSWGIFINEVYGARVGGIGGVKLSGNIIDASEIRKRLSTSTVDSGGKGAPKVTEKKTSYYQDIDMAFGRGRLRFLKILFVGVSGASVQYDITAPTVTGIIDESWPGQLPQDHFLLPDPETPDTYPADRFGFVPTPDAEGMIEVRLANGGTARLYEGNETQLPDPLFESIHGVGQTPAYRGMAHIVFENMDISEGHPNIVVIAENMDYQTLDEIVQVRAERAGAESADLDFTELSAKSVMGFYVSQRQAPRADMEILARVYDADFYEGTNGKINGVLIDETVVETLDADYIGAGSGEGMAVTVQSREKAEDELPFRLDFAASDPENNYETATRGATRQVTTSSRHETIELPLTLTTSELQKLANRELQEMWRAAGSFTFTTTHHYRNLLPTQKIKVPFGGRLRDARIRERRGTVPGLLTFTCTPCEGIILDSIGDAASAGIEPTPSVPANTVITLIDLPRLHSPQDVPGFMWAGAARDPSSGEWTRAVLWADKGAGYQVADVSEGPATMGRMVNALPDVPVGWTEGDWDEVSTATADFFYGELENLTDAQVLDGAGIYVIGNEVVGIATQAVVGGHANRWTGSRMQRRLKGTSSAGHVAGERIVLLNNAVRFVKVDESEKDVARTYKATTVTPNVSQPLEDAAEVPFEWTGQSIEVDQTIEGTFTADTLEATDGQIDNITSSDIRAAQMRIGAGGTDLTTFLKGAVAIDPASIAAGAVSPQTATLTGALVGDALNLNPPAAGLTAGLIVLQSYVSATNQITIVFQNTTAGAIDEPSASWTYTLIRS